jgi:general secretion pathway protein K
MRSSQQGVALITAVLIVALVTTIAVAMASRQQLDIRRSANIFDSDQAWLAALGGEDYARNVLAADGKNSSVDNLEEDWAQPVQFPFEGMVLSGVMEDMQGRFNLNNLIDSNGAVIPLEQQRFERLLTLLDLDQAIAQGVLDWLDSDINPRMGGGAEDDFYMEQQPGYRAANRLMASASELRLVSGVTAEAYKKLAPFVVALPKRAAININTAPAEVLAMVANNLTVADGETLVTDRGKKGYGTVQEFLDHPLLKPANINDDGLSVKSDYFLLNAMAEFDSARSQLFSLLERQQGGEVKVVMRGRGAY